MHVGLKKKKAQNQTLKVKMGKQRGNGKRVSSIFILIFSLTSSSPVPPSHIVVQNL